MTSELRIRVRLEDSNYKTINLCNVKQIQWLNDENSAKSVWFDEIPEVIVNLEQKDILLEFTDNYVYVTVVNAGARMLEGNLKTEHN